MLDWIKKAISFFNIFRPLLSDFFKAVFTQATAKAIEELKDHAIDIVKGLSISDLTNSAKRKEALKLIKQRAKDLGLEVGESVLNLTIELALQYVKNAKDSALNG